MVARVTQAWRDAWPSRPLITAITLGFVAVGVAVGLLLGLLFERAIGAVLTRPVTPYPAFCAG